MQPVTSYSRLEVTMALSHLVYEILKATSHYTIQVADLVAGLYQADLVCDLVAYL